MQTLVANSTFDDIAIPPTPSLIQFTKDAVFAEFNTDICMSDGIFL